MGRFKLDFMNPGTKEEPFWFDSREELDAFVELLTSCPVDDGPALLRITEYNPGQVEFSYEWKTKN